MLLSVKDRSTGKGYWFIEELGRGTFGTCYMAVEGNSENYRALKVCKGEKSSSEIDIHSKLSHGNIVKLFCSFRFEKSSCMVMELCVNGTVDLLLKCRKNLTDPEVRFLIRQVVQGLQYLHGNLVVHRDLKLKNLLLSSSMVVKIGDFGLSKKLTHPDERRVTICGTQGYVAPEVIESAGHGFEADIWALGCIIYTLLDGKEPFAGKTNEETSRNICKSAYASSNKINSKAKALLKAIFVSDPEDRPTAHNVLDQSYFCTGITPNTLDFTCYYQKPTFKGNGKSDTANKKCLPLRDLTNHVANQRKATALQHPSTNTGKENKINEWSKEATFQMALRPRKPGAVKTALAPENFHAMPSLEDSIIDGGAQIAGDLLDALRYVLTRLEPEEWSLKKKESSFICVRRWVAGLSAFGYHLSDGSMCAHFPDNVIVHRACKGTELFYQAEGSVHRFEGKKIAADLERTLRYLDSCLKALDGVGPEHCYSEPPVVVVSKKFFSPDAKLSPFASPKIAFVLSNGACQVSKWNDGKYVEYLSEFIFSQRKQVFLYRYLLQ